MQEHRYTNQKAWAPGAWPSLQTEHLENIHEIVANHYDPESRRFKSPLELQAQRERREEKEVPKAFTVDDRMIDDWTGEKHMETFRETLKKPEQEALLMIA